MNTLTRWSPFRQAARTDPISDMEQMFRGFGLRPLLQEAETPLEMRMDITEDEQAYQVTIDIPGVRKEDIELSIDRNQVSVSAEVKRETSKKEGRELHTERYQGSAFRSFTLPRDIDDAKAKAQYENGVLHLTLPKKADARANRIAIQ